MMYKILQNKKIANSVYKMLLEGDTSNITAPGQFINVKLEGFFLRRPISICDYDKKTVTIIYKTVGEGTQYMSTLAEGEMLDCLVGLGNGYSLNDAEKPVLIGGGVGVPPLFVLAKKLIKNGKKPVIVLGFNTKDEVFLENDFKAIGCETHVATVDGSYGIKGFVTDVLNSINYDYFYTCGPMPMFRAVEACAKSDGQFSFEERMGCGFGACMGCSCKTKNGYKRICKDGPVLERSEIIW